MKVCLLSGRRVVVSCELCRSFGIPGRSASNITRQNNDIAAMKVSEWDSLCVILIVSSTLLSLFSFARCWLLLQVNIVEVHPLDWFAAEIDNQNRNDPHKTCFMPSSNGAGHLLVGKCRKWHQPILSEWVKIPPACRANCSQIARGSLYNSTNMVEISQQALWGGRGAKLHSTTFYNKFIETEY